MPFPRSGSRGPGGVLRTGPTPHQDSPHAPPRARRPPGQFPGPDSTSHAHTIYKRKDSTSQSSAGSMATVASGILFPPLNLPGQARPSREEWARLAFPGGGAQRCPSAGADLPFFCRAQSGVLRINSPGKMTSSQGFPGCQFQTGPERSNTRWFYERVFADQRKRPDKIRPVKIRILCKTESSFFIYVHTRTYFFIKYVHARTSWQCSG